MTATPHMGKDFPYYCLWRLLEPGDVVDVAIQAAVKEKKLCLTSETASFFAEDIPAGVLSDNAYLQAPPQPVPVKDILPENLPEAWSGETTTALEISHALSTKVGKMLPWITVREAIDGAFRSRLIERTDDSGGWPCGQYISLKGLSWQAQRREDQAGRQNRETDPQDQRAQVEALGASWVCTCGRPA